MGEEKQGFFKRLVSGLTKTRDNIVSGMDSIFHRHSPSSVGDHDKLGILRQLVEILGKPPHVAVVQSRLNLVQQTKGRRLQVLDREQQGDGCQRLFPTGELHHMDK